ncbi:Acyl-CoA Delta(11) desaturase [Eumeta japonica]|uniref:Acyl-CoA Delta(11) desaturase n=1 Tax=Eumeta variegata TaxID=151549 RepID=A0A4C1UJ59_EUMVA|nr:Acyl-CoA Delta(11) desaturase [Eumeta japonica]
MNKGEFFSSSIQRCGLSLDSSFENVAESSIPPRQVNGNSWICGQIHAKCVYNEVTIKSITAESLNPRENIGVWMICVEGFHNFHHTFPWDYRATELPLYNMLTPTITFIEAMAYIGQAYDLKSVTPDIVKRRSQRTGDGTHHLWGWDDPEFTAGLKKQFATVKNAETTD